MAQSRQHNHYVTRASDLYSDEDRGIYCEPCSKAGHAVAEFFRGLCFNSNRRHSNPFPSEAIEKPLENQVLDKCEEKCPIHPNKVTEFFCETCDKLGCSSCVKRDKCQTKQLQYIPDIVKNLEKTEEFKKFKEDIKLTGDVLSKQEEKLKTNVIFNKQMRKLAKQELGRQKAELLIFFHQLEEKTDAQLKEIQKRNKRTLKAASRRLDRTKQDFDKISNEIEAKHTEQRCELFIAMKGGKEKMMTIHGQFTKMQGEPRLEKYILVPSEQIQALIRNTTEICSIVLPRLESAIDIKTKTDKKEPYIGGLAILNVHHCIVADIRNASIKVIDTKTKQVTSEINIEAKIQTIFPVGGNQIAVLVTISRKRGQIQFFTVSASGTIHRLNQHYDCDGSLRGIVDYEGNMYGLRQDGIDVLNTKRNIMRRIQIDAIDTGMFGNLSQITVSPDGQTLYVTDSGKGSVISLTMEGVKNVYTSEDLECPQGITVDKHGYVYVRYTDKILQLTADLNMVQVLIEDVLGAYITYSSYENKLYLNDGNQINQYSLLFK